jgi:hypothetical protein
VRNTVHLAMSAMEPPASVTADFTFSSA